MKIGILGGGLAGLTVASAIKNHDCEVLEADSVIGGHCRSLVEDGYTFDLGGPHIIYSKNENVLAYMLEMLGDNVVSKERVNKIWVKDRYIKYPFENGLGDLDPEDRAACAHDYILAYFMRTVRPHKDDFRQWIQRNCGRAMAEMFMLPYNEKIWKRPLYDMATDWCDGRVPQAPWQDVLKSACGVQTEGYTHQLRYWYPKTGGIEALPRAFAAKCENITTSFPVYHVSRHKQDGLWSVTDGKQMRQYDRLISTIPIRDLLASLGNGTLPTIPEDVREAADGLRFNSLITVMIGLPSRPAVQFPFLAVFVPDPEIIFHRLSFPNHLVMENAPAGKTAITAEITVNPGDNPSDEEIIEQVGIGLERMGGLLSDRTILQGRRHDDAFVRIHRTKHAYVVPTHGHRERLKTCLDYLDGLGIVSVGRNALHAYQNMDQVIEGALKVAKDMDVVEVAV